MTQRHDATSGATDAEKQAHAEAGEQGLLFDDDVSPLPQDDLAPLQAA